MIPKYRYVEDGDKILDVGCGIGGSSIWLAKNFHCNVVGVNITPAQVEKARRLAKESGVSDLTNFYVEDYNKTSFRDKSFDVIWVLESICYAESKKVFLQEAWRILKSGGRLIVADGFLDKRPSSEREKRRLKSCLEGWVVPNLTSVDEFQDHLKTIGYHNTTFIDITKNVLPSSRRMYLAALFNYPFAKTKRILGLTTKVRMMNIHSAFYQYVLLNKHLWIYGIFCAEKPRIKHT